MDECLLRLLILGLSRAGQNPWFVAIMKDVRGREGLGPSGEGLVMTMPTIANHLVKLNFKWAGELNRRTFWRRWIIWYLPMHLNSSICGNATVFRFDNLRDRLIVKLVTSLPILKRSACGWRESLSPKSVANRAYSLKVTKAQIAVSEVQIGNW